MVLLRNSIELWFDGDLKELNDYVWDLLGDNWGNEKEDIIPITEASPEEIKKYKLIVTVKEI